MILAIRVIPRARKNAVAGMRGDALLMRLAAPPVEGAANDALIAYLAELFERPRRNFTILSGHKSRDKRVQIDGLSDADARARLSAMLKVTPDDSR
jgi:uncharacterized protein (TIGR00251 family)